MIQQTMSGFYSSACGWMFDRMNSQFHLDDIDCQLTAAFILFIIY